jgi:hypothetical protein
MFMTTSFSKRRIELPRFPRRLFGGRFVETDGTSAEVGDEQCATKHGHVFHEHDLLKLGVIGSFTAQNYAS